MNKIINLEAKNATLEASRLLFKIDNKNLDELLSGEVLKLKNEYERCIANISLKIEILESNLSLTNNFDTVVNSSVLDSFINDIEESL